MSGQGRFCRECGGALASGVETSPSQSSLKESETSGDFVPQVAKVTPKKSNPLGLFIAWTGIAVLASRVLLFAFWMLSSALGGGEEEEEASPATSQAAPQVQERPSDLSATDCLTIEGNVKAVEDV